MSDAFAPRAATSTSFDPLAIDPPAFDSAAADAARRDAGALAPFSLPVYRMLWFTALFSSTSLWMNDVAAAWLMTTLSTSPVMVALVATASTLPMFLLGLPSGALADIVDRRRYLLATQVWVASIALINVLVVVTGTINATLLLVLTFCNGLGLAMRLPIFAAVVPEIVPRAQLPAALALNGVSMNASRIIGPMLAGALIANAGIVWVFALNALLSAVNGFFVWRWKHERQTVSALPGERFVGAIRLGVQYVRQSERMHRCMARVAAFFFQSAALMALLPLVARELHGTGAASYTVLLSSMGAGAIASAFFLPQMRRRFHTDAIVAMGSIVQAAMSLVVAWSPSIWLSAPAMTLAGVAWLSVANSLSVAAQLGLPDWVRARAMSIFQMALMGGAAIGAAVWGQVATFTDLRTSIALAAVFSVAWLFALRHWKLNDLISEDLTPTRAWTPPSAVGDIAPDAGPVMVTVEYRIDPARADDFRAVMQKSRRSRLQHGALAWELFRDSTDPARFIEYFIDETWVDHLRRYDRVTAADVALREERNSFHLGSDPPTVHRSIAQ